MEVRGLLQQPWGLLAGGGVVPQARPPLTRSGSAQGAAASCQSVHAPRPPGPGHPTPTAERRSRAGGGRGKEGQTC